MKLKQLNSDFSTVLFDLDGTLVDSMWMWADIDREYLARFDKTFYPELQREIEGMNINETAVFFKERFDIPRTVEEMIRDWVEMSYSKYRDEVCLKPYTAEFLRFLKEHDIKIGIATSNAEKMVRACLESNSIIKYFDTIVTADDVERGKPSPDVYLHAANILGSRPEECIVFEDVPAGILAGKAAGMETIAVYDEFSEMLYEEKLKLADHYITDYSELL